MRHPLRLSRLEVRYRRPLRRHADLLSRSRCQGSDPHQILPGARVGRHDLGLYGPGGASPRIARAGDGAGAGLASLRLEEMAGLQLGAGAGRLDRHRAFHLRASLLRKGRERNPRYQEAFCESACESRHRSHALVAEDPRPVIKINPHEAGLTIAGGRLTGTDNIYWRIAQFLMPVHSYAPSSMPGENI